MAEIEVQEVEIEAVPIHLKEEQVFGTDPASRTKCH